MHSAVQKVVCWVDPTVVLSGKSRAGLWVHHSVELRAASTVGYLAVCLVVLKAERLVVMTAARWVAWMVE